MQPVPHDKMQAFRIASEVVAVGKPALGRSWQSMMLARNGRISVS